MNKLLCLIATLTFALITALPTLSARDRKLGWCFGAK